jgi:flavin-dependent dehydrogenase
MPSSSPDSGSVDVDALIVGAGPVGLYAAYCLLRSLARL